MSGYARVFGDPKSKSVFRYPILSATDSKTWDEVIGRITEAIQHIVKFDDDRVLAIQGAILLEMQ